MAGDWHNITSTNAMTRVVVDFTRNDDRRVDAALSRVLRAGSPSGGPARLTFAP
jgi:hypothetical protein